MSGYPFLGHFSLFGHSPKKSLFDNALMKSREVFQILVFEMVQFLLQENVRGAGVNLRFNLIPLSKIAFFYNVGKYTNPQQLTFCPCFYRPSHSLGLYPKTLMGPMTGGSKISCQF